VVNLGVPDRFLPHGSPAGLRAELGLDAGGIARAAARLCQVPALRADRSA
jgi:deoxyxylulose-5-phosphate synthase